MTTTRPIASPPSATPFTLEPPERTELTLAMWLAGIVTRWRMVAWCVAAAIAVAGLAVLIIPPVYRAKASFVTNNSGGMKLPSSIAGGALAGFASQLGVSTGGDPSESPNFYAQLLTSRELLTRLLESRFPDPRTGVPSDSASLLELMKIRNSDPQRRLEIAIKDLEDDMRVEFDPKTNLVSFSVGARWSVLSAAVANRVMDLVSRFNGEQRQTRARAKREFLQQRVDSAQAALTAAESRLRVFYEANRQWQTSPALTFEEQRLERQTQLAADLYTSLRREYEAARISEVDDGPLITVVDSAVAPRKKTWPRYGLTLLSALFVGALLGLVIAGTATVFADWKRRNPRSAEALGSALMQLRADVGALRPTVHRHRRTE